MICRHPAQWIAAAIAVTVAAMLGANASADPPIDPFPAPSINDGIATQWSFEKDDENWQAVNDARAWAFRAAGAGVLRISPSGDDPYLHGPAIDVEGTRLEIRLRLRCEQPGNVEVFFSTAESKGFRAGQSKSFAAAGKWKWEEHAVVIEPRGSLLQLRLDPSRGQGEMEIDSISISRLREQPVQLSQVRVVGQTIHATLRNRSNDLVAVRLNDTPADIEARGSVDVKIDVDREPAFESVPLKLVVKDFPPITRTVHLFRPDGQASLDSLAAGDLELLIADKGKGAIVRRKGKIVAVMSPLLLAGGSAVRFKSVTVTGKECVLQAERAELRFTLNESAVGMSVSAEDAVEGPAIRALGELEQGLFAGVEYLGKGEASSSTKDIRTSEHIRFAPDPMHVTMPLMAFVTGDATVALTWDDMAMQPVFATPNFFDGTGDHRMTLRAPAHASPAPSTPAAPAQKPAARLTATLRISAGWDEGGRLEDAILWAVRRSALPALPPRPRNTQEQYDIALKALNGKLRSDKGWGHCAEDHWDRRFFVDHASTLWRLTGQIPQTPELIPHGAHIHNNAAFFVTGRGSQFMQHLANHANAALKAQQPDGSFRYQGKYADGHFEDTASGYCAFQALRLLEHARHTVDKASLAAAEKTLRWMTRFRTPRGAQTWEVPLHTPDILASAHLVRAYVIGHELTGKKEYLDEARRWAITGVPFIYQWGNRPIMPYATIAVLGATNWEAPNWIGLPVQWCGLVYAESLLMLAPHDSTLDWKRVAEGILISGEQQQYPDGPFIGCLPDSIALRTQERRPWNINPCALVSLRMLIEGQEPALSVARGGVDADGNRRVIVSPFPVRIEANKAIIAAKAGVKYQIAIDGVVREVESKGTDEVILPNEPGTK